MARVLKNFDWGDDYPWKEWEDGQTREAYINKDFDVKSTFVAALHKHAKDLNGIEVRTRTPEARPDNVIFQFFKPKKKRTTKKKTETSTKAPKAPKPEPTHDNNIANYQLEDEPDIEPDDTEAPYGRKIDGTPKKKPGRPKRTEQDLINDLREKIRETPKDPKSTSLPTSGERPTLEADISKDSDTDAAIMPGDSPVRYSTQSKYF